MKLFFLTIASLFVATLAQAQTTPTITSWLQNTTVTARHYVSGNSTPIVDAALVNCQKVQYNTTNVYVTTTGLPSYVTGPFLDNNPSLATSQNAIFKFPLTPVANTGTPTNTTGGNIGVFINGVALFDYRDGVAWNNTTSTLCGGPGNSPCPGGMGAAQAWNRDAIPAEKRGFDCSKAHPAMGNYHHHQNPSAFDLDLNVISTVCSLYDADGLYAIDSTVHSPLLGFAYDGFPIYGAYAHKNVNGTGGIVRMKSSYSLNTATTRAAGPNVGTVVGTQTFFNGYFREDYRYTATSAATPDYLDVHNGRFCVTPEYPNGTYCYFTTVDARWNSAYPYVVGPTFYGTVQSAKVTTVPTGTTTYVPTVAVANTNLESTEVKIFPNPSSDLIVVQLIDLNKENLKVELFDITGRLIATTNLLQGSTIAYFDTKTLYSGQYLIKISNEKELITKKVIVTK